MTEGQGGTPPDPSTATTPAELIALLRRLGEWSGQSALTNLDELCTAGSIEGYVAGCLLARHWTPADADRAAAQWQATLRRIRQEHGPWPAPQSPPPADDTAVLPRITAADASPAASGADGASLASPAAGVAPETVDSPTTQLPVLPRDNPPSEHTSEMPVVARQVPPQLDSTTEMPPVPVGRATASAVPDMPAAHRPPPPEPPTGAAPAAAGNPRRRTPGPRLAFAATLAVLLVIGVSVVVLRSDPSAAPVAAATAGASEPQTSPSAGASASASPVASPTAEAAGGSRGERVTAQETTAPEPPPPPPPPPPPGPEPTQGQPPPDEDWSKIVDNSSNRFTASSAWHTATGSTAHHGSDFRRAAPDTERSDPAWYRVDIPETGRYRVDVWYPASDDNNDATPYIVVTTTGQQIVHVNQQRNGGQWVNLGTFTLAGGDEDVVAVSRWAAGTSPVVADAIRVTQL